MFGIIDLPQHLTGSKCAVLTACLLHIMHCICTIQHLHCMSGVTQSARWSLRQTPMPCTLRTAADGQNHRSCLGVTPVLSKARHWAQPALETAPNAKEKAVAVKMLAEIQDHQRQFSDSSWAALLQAQFEGMQNGELGAAPR
jgi:hypothetical protein